MTTLDDTRYGPMCEDAAKKILELERKLRVEERFRINSLTCPAPGHDYWQRWYEARLSVETEELEQRVKVLTGALTRIRDEDIGTAKCVSIAYKALAQLPNESDSPETDLDEALRRQ